MIGRIGADARDNPSRDGMKRYSIFSLARNALSRHEDWPAAWRSPEPKTAYDAIIVGGGGHGLALAYAISPRGGCHVSSPMLSMEAGARYYPEIDFEYDLEPMTDENKAEAAVTAVELGSIENSACFCEFADREITITQWRDLFNAVAGYGWDIEEMMRAGRRVFFLKRLINYRYGCRAADDALTPRMLSAATDGEPEGILINFIAMKKKFYQLTEIDPDKGIPTLSCLETYQMEKEAALVW